MQTTLPMSMALLSSRGHRSRGDQVKEAEVCSRGQACCRQGVPDTYKQHRTSYQFFHLLGGTYSSFQQVSKGLCFVCHGKATFLGSMLPFGKAEHRLWHVVDFLISVSPIRPRGDVSIVPQNVMSNCFAFTLKALACDSCNRPAFTLCIDP